MITLGTHESWFPVQWSLPVLTEIGSFQPNHVWSLQETHEQTQVSCNGAAHDIHDLQNEFDSSRQEHSTSHE